MATTGEAAVHHGSLPFPLSLFVNGPLLSAVIAFFIAQLTKFIMHYVQADQLDWSKLWASGGMPSSHTALVTGLAAAVCVREGGDSSLFALTFVLAAITAYDATGVRLHAGRQASVLNVLVQFMPPEVRGQACVGSFGSQHVNCGGARAVAVCVLCNMSGCCLGRYVQRAQHAGLVTE